MTEHDAFTLAMEEIKSGKTNEATWLKAYAHSNGDDESTRAKYLLFRAESLRSEHQRISNRQAIHAIFRAATVLAAVLGSIGLLIFGVIVFLASAVPDQPTYWYRIMHGFALVIFLSGILAMSRTISWLKRPNRSDVAPIVK